VSASRALIDELEASASVEPREISGPDCQAPPDQDFARERLGLVVRSLEQRREMPPSLFPATSRGPLTAQFSSTARERTSPLASFSRTSGASAIGKRSTTVRTFPSAARRSTSFICARLPRIVPITV
jgi:hypothetical protein